MHGRMIWQRSTLGDHQLMGKLPLTTKDIPHYRMFLVGKDRLIPLFFLPCGFFREWLGAEKGGSGVRHTGLSIQTVPPRVICVYLRLSYIIAYYVTVRLIHYLP